MAKKKKIETVEDILDRIQEDIDLIREKCVCNGDEDYSLYTHLPRVLLPDAENYPLF